MKEQKRALRQKLKNQSEAIISTAGPTQRKKMPPTAAIWTAEVFEKAGLNDYKTLFSFLSFPTEPDTAALNALALAQGLIVAVPKVHGADMGFYQIMSAEGPFTSGAYGIREPASDAPVIWHPGSGGEETAVNRITYPLLIAVPGLAFTRDGRRLGRGGGYYDRFIAALRNQEGTQKAVTLMGICPEDAVIPHIPTESHDARVDCLLTEKGYIICEPFSER